MDYPASVAFWESDRLYSLLRAPPETKAAIQECHCEQVVWVEPDGTKLVKLGRNLSPHNCKLPPDLPTVEPYQINETPTGITSRPEYQSEI